MFSFFIIALEEKLMKKIDFYIKILYKKKNLQNLEGINSIKYR